MIEFRFERLNNGKKEKGCILSLKDVRLLMGGIFYARERDSIEGRKEEYKELMRKLNEVIGEMARRG